MHSKEVTQLKLPLYSSQKINSVKGEMSISTLGRVLVHEHVFCRCRKKNIPHVEQFLDEQFTQLLKSGINTIIDVTTYVRPDMLVPFLNTKSINVITCTGFYVRNRVQKTYYDATVDTLVEKMSKDIDFGVGQYRVKPGVIKVASQGRQLTEFEKRVMKSAAEVQRLYPKIPVITHAYRGGRKQVELLVKNGADPSKIVISHMEMELKGSSPTSFENLLDDMLWILDTGANLFLGDFSLSTTAYRDQVIHLAKLFKSRGHLKQIFLSTDSYWSWKSGEIKIRGTAANARIRRDYNYVNNLTIPLLSRNDFNQSDFDQILHVNPVRLFS